MTTKQYAHTELAMVHSDLPLLIACLDILTRRSFGNRPAATFVKEAVKLLEEAKTNTWLELQEIQKQVQASNTEYVSYLPKAQPAKVKKQSLLRKKRR